MKTIGVYCAKPIYVARIQYVLDFIQRHPLKPEEPVQFVLNPTPSLPINISIAYGPHPRPTTYLIPQQKLLFSDAVLSNLSLSCRAYEDQNSHIHSVEAKSNPRLQDAFIAANVFGFDLVETLFFHLSRYEEYHCSGFVRDPWDMMWERDQLLVRHGLQQLPVVDQLVLALYRALGFATDDRQTTYSLSHDIDVLEKYRGTKRSLRSFARAFLDNGIDGIRKNMTFYAKSKFNSKKDPFNSFFFLLVDSSTIDFQDKVLYLMAGGETKHDNYYQVNNPIIEQCIALAEARGYQIGLHGSYNSGFKADLLSKEKQRLEQVLEADVIHNRQHFLRFSFEKTPAILEDAGIAKDSTLGYQRMIGFRCGTGFPYQLYSFVEERPYSFLEQPMVVMDGALLEESSGDLDEAMERLGAFQSQNLLNTHITYNVHNSIFDPVKRDLKKMKKLYTLMVGK